MFRPNDEQRNEDDDINDENELDPLDAAAQVREEEFRDSVHVLIVISNLSNKQICAPYLVCTPNTSSGHQTLPCLVLTSSLGSQG